MRGAGTEGPCLSAAVLVECGARMTFVCARDVLANPITPNTWDAIAAGISTGREFAKYAVPRGSR